MFNGSEIFAKASGIKQGMLCPNADFKLPHNPFHTHPEANSCELESNSTDGKEGSIHRNARHIFIIS